MCGKFILDCFVQTGYLAIVSSRAPTHGSFNKSHRLNTRALRVAPNGRGLGVGEFNINVLLYEVYRFVMHNDYLRRR